MCAPDTRQEQQQAPHTRCKRQLPKYKRLFKELNSLSSTREIHKRFCAHNSATTATGERRRSVSSCTEICTGAQDGRYFFGGERCCFGRSSGIDPTAFQQRQDTEHTRQGVQGRVHVLLRYVSATLTINKRATNSEHGSAGLAAIALQENYLDVLLPRPKTVNELVLLQH